MAVRRISLFGIRIHALSLDEAVDLLIALARDKRPHYVVTPNAHHIVQIRRDAHLRQIYNNADVVLADGMSIVWASRLLGKPLPERVAGIDLLERLCGRVSRNGYRLFLLGAKPGVAVQAARRLEERYPGLQIVGIHHGYFSAGEERAVIEKIKSAAPDVLLVGLGFPKQELWMSRYARECGVPLSIGVGAAFDFIAGIRRRAPLWMQQAGLEWLHRLLQEPRRLWHRYLVLGPQFVCLTLAELMRARKEALLKTREIPNSKREQDQ